jgi:hypothetical protein
MAPYHKPALVVDLDHTLVHSTSDERLIEHILLHPHEHDLIDCRKHTTPSNRNRSQHSRRSDGCVHHEHSQSDCALYLFRGSDDQHFLVKVRPGAFAMLAEVNHLSRAFFFFLFFFLSFMNQLINQIFCQNKSFVVLSLCCSGSTVV